MWFAYGKPSRMRFICSSRWSVHQRDRFGTNPNFMGSLGKVNSNIMYAIFSKQSLSSTINTRSSTEILSHKIYCWMTSTKLSLSILEQPRIFQGLILRGREMDWRVESPLNITLEHQTIWLPNASIIKHQKRSQIFTPWVEFYTTSK